MIAINSKRISDALLSRCMAILDERRDNNWFSDSETIELILEVAFLEWEQNSQQKAG